MNIFVKMIKYIFEDFRANFKLYFKVIISNICTELIIMGMAQVEIGQVSQYWLHYMLLFN